MFRLFEYPENWDEIRKGVYRKDNYSCQRCGIRNVRLHAHHLIPLSEGGSDEIENLVSLCENCHKDMHFGMKYGWIVSIIGIANVFLISLSPVFFFIGLTAILFLVISGIIEINKTRRELLEKVQMNLKSKQNFT